MLDGCTIVHKISTEKIFRICAWSETRLTEINNVYNSRIKIRTILFLKLSLDETVNYEIVWHAMVIFHWYILNTLWIKCLKCLLLSNVFFMLQRTFRFIYTCLCVSPSPLRPVKTAQDDTLIKKYLLLHPGNTRCGLDSPSKVIERKLETLLTECCGVQVSCRSFT